MSMCRHGRMAAATAAIAIAVGGLLASAGASSARAAESAQTPAAQQWAAWQQAHPAIEAEAGCWYWAGPFGPVAAGGDALAATFEPEQGPVDLKATFKALGGRSVAWHQQAPEDGRGLRFRSGRIREGRTVVHLCRTLHADRAVQYPVKITAGPAGAGVWLNGKAVAAAGARGAATVVLDLQAGDNLLMLKVIAETDSDGPSVNFETPAVVRDRAEAAFLDKLVAERPFAEVRPILIERQIREDYDHLLALMGKAGYWKKAAATALREEALILPTDRDPADIVLRRTRALLADLLKTSAAGKLAAATAELAELEQQAAAVDPARRAERFGLYGRTCALRRRIALANPLLDFGDIVFVKHHMAVTSHMCDQYFGCFANPGGGLYVLAGAFGETPVVRDVLAGLTIGNGRLKGKALAGGSFLQPELSYDGGSVLFSYTECGLGTKKPSPRAWFGDPIWSDEMSFHAFRVDVAGGNLVQLTDGAWNDLNPNWLPDGRVVFMSERRGGFGRCHARPVPIYTLHAMDADGRNMVRLSHHESNEWHPSVNNEGMIVYSRWDYVDRGHNQAHHPWITTPDGRDARAIQGNFKRSHDDNPDMELSVVAVPGSPRYVATASAHHNQAYGSLIVLDPRAEDDNAMGPVRRLTPDCGLPETSENGGMEYATAWPLSESYYLCSYDAGGAKHGLYLLDAFGNRELLYRDPKISCLGPVAVRPRPVPPIIPAVGTPARLVDNPTWRVVGDEHPMAADSPGLTDKAVVGLVNVYDSFYPIPDGVKIKNLRIVHILPKSAPIHHVPQIGYGSETSARAVLGTVPVEPDGSASFYLPPGKGVYFQALDERGCAVQSMRSATYVHGGEKLLCAGCHEPKSQASARASGVEPLAFRRDPSTIQPAVEGARPFSFPRLVQPVLDKNCVACHQKNVGKAPDLRPGDWQGHVFQWYQSYRSLRGFAFHYGAERDEKVKDQYDGWQPGRTVPGKFGARASKLLAMLDKGHHDLKLSAEEFARLILWLDCNSDFFGAYENTDAQCRGEVVRPKVE